MNDKKTSRTVIGPETVVSGEIRSGQDLVVQGRVEGSLRVDAVLFIEEGGAAEAEVTANHVVVAGNFNGALTATDALEIAETGRIEGSVAAPRMVVADGALVNAEIRMSGDAGDVRGDAAGASAETRQAGAGERTVYSYTVPAGTGKTEAAVEETAAEVEVVEAAAAPKTRKKKKKKS